MSPVSPVDHATMEIFQNALTGKNGRKRYCNAVRVLAQRATIVPQANGDCIICLVEISKKWGARNVVSALADLGIKCPDAREFCQQAVKEVSFASS